MSVERMPVIQLLDRQRSGIGSTVATTVAAARARDLDWSVLVLRPGSSRPISGLLRAYKSLLASCRKRSPKGSSIIIHTHSFLPRVLVYALQLQLGENAVRHFTTLHSDYPYWHSTDLKARLKRLVERAVVRRCEGIVACSEGVRISGERALRTRSIQVIFNGFDVPEVPWDPKPLQVLAVGRFSEEKNYPALISAWAHVVRREPHATLHLVGDGHCRSRIEDAVRRFSLADNVVLTGWLTGERLHNAYADASVLVITSTFEGLPSTAIEAQLMARPVVSTRVHGIAQILDEGITGFIIDGMDELTSKLLELLADARMSRQLGERGRERASKLFSVETQIDRLLQLYRRRTEGNS